MCWWFLTSYLNLFHIRQRVIPANKTRGMIYEQPNCTTNNLFAIFNDILLDFDFRVPHKVKGCCIGCPILDVQITQL